MDPNQTLIDLLEEFSSSDYDRLAALDLLSDLECWLEREGPPPKVDWFTTASGKAYQVVD